MDNPDSEDLARVPRRNHVVLTLTKLEGLALQNQPLSESRRRPFSAHACPDMASGAQYNLSMISEKVRKEIDRAQIFGEQIEEAVVSKNQLPTGDRNVLLIAYWALMFDYHKGILALLQSELSGAAFALVRPVVEAVVRAHVTVMGSKGDLLSIQKDEYKVNFKEIGARIDAAFALEGLMENFLNDVTRNALHSYTHSGILQLGRRFDGTDIKPNYKDDEIIEVIRATTSAIFMVTNLVTKHFGFDHDWERVSQLYAEWGAHS